MYFRVLRVALTVMLSLGYLSAQEAGLETTDTAAPEEVSPEMRGVMDAKGYAVSVDGKVTARFWFRKDPPLVASPSSELGITFGQLEPGSLIGVVQLVENWSDYKGNNISAGIYTMRYGVMPADGNHMGVSPYRDFLLLIPSAQDTAPGDSLGYADLVSSSVAASGVPHPAVLALFPIWDQVSEPTLTKNEMDQWTLAIKLGAQVVGLVIVGHGEI